MSMQYVWYDYETTGKRRFGDRIVQFGALRTDKNLESIGDKIVLHCKPQIDCLPQPGASMTHGISLRSAIDHGLTEHELATEIDKLFAPKGTCAVAFSGMRFDHVFTRALMYRNLRPPYAWEAFNDNTKWDPIDLFRAAHALSPQGIEFPDEDPIKGPVFKLEHLAAANDRQVGKAHDALADVYTMLELAKLVRGQKRKLYDYFLSLRKKEEVRKKVDDTFIYVSGRFFQRPKKASVMKTLDIDRMGNVYAYDLSADPLRVLQGQRLPDGSEAKDAIRKFKLNASPFVVKINDLGTDTRPSRFPWLDRLGLDLATLQENRNALELAPNLLDQVWPDRDVRDRGDRDVDERLYDGLIEKQDGPLLSRILRSTGTPSSEWEQLPFKDDRLPELVFRFRARNFPRSLSQGDKARWYGHIRTKLFENQDAEGRTEYELFTSKIAKHRELQTDQKKLKLLDELEQYGAWLRKKVMGQGHS